MPGNSYKVDIAQLNQALGGKISHCPLCQKNHTFNAVPTLLELREFHGGDFILGTPIVPLVALICNNCGNVILLNALTAGLLKEPITEEETEEKGKNEQ